MALGTSSAAGHRGDRAADGQHAAEATDHTEAVPFLGKQRPRCADPVAREAFEDAGNLHSADRAVRRAQAICRRCPYLEACGAYALATGQVWGVWGALSVKDRLTYWRSNGGRPVTYSSGGMPKSARGGRVVVQDIEIQRGGVL